MTPGELSKSRKARGLSQAKLGKLLGYSRVAVNTWENGRFNIPDEIESKLTELDIPIIPEDSEAIKAYQAARVIFKKDHAACLRHVQVHYFAHELNPDGFTPEDMRQLVTLYPDILEGSGK